MDLLINWNRFVEHVFWAMKRIYQMMAQQQVLNLANCTYQSMYQDQYENEY